MLIVLSDRKRAVKTSEGKLKVVFIEDFNELSLLEREIDSLCNLSANSRSNTFTTEKIGNKVISSGVTEPRTTSPESSSSLTNLDVAIISSTESVAAAHAVTTFTLDTTNEQIASSPAIDLNTATDQSVIISKAGIPAKQQSGNQSSATEQTATTVSMESSTEQRVLSQKDNQNNAAGRDVATTSFEASIEVLSTSQPVSREIATTQPAAKVSLETSTEQTVLSQTDNQNNAADKSVATTSSDASIKLPSTPQPANGDTATDQLGTTITLETSTEQTVLSQTDVQNNAADQFVTTTSSNVPNV